MIVTIVPVVVDVVAVVKGLHVKTLAVMASRNIVCEWLRVIGMSQYAASFMENGYDELEICKQIGEIDLDAIGVEDAQHRHKLLKSVRNLREKGAASVYVMINDPKALSSSNEILAGCDTSPEKLETVMKKHLEADGIRLTAHPYSTPEGKRGYLEGLAAHYCKTLSTPYEDVLNAIEKVRVSKWTERHVRIASGLTTGRPHHRGGNQSCLPNSQSQPIYVPGKYLPSSCLSNREENEIYSFTQNDLAARMARSAIDTKSAVNLCGMQNSYPQTRSNFFYDFASTEGRKSKRRTMFTRFLNGLRHSGDDLNQTDGMQLKTNERLSTKCAATKKEPHQNFEETIHRLKTQKAARKKDKGAHDRKEVLYTV